MTSCNWPGLYMCGEEAGRSYFPPFGHVCFIHYAALVDAGIMRRSDPDTDVSRIMERDYKPAIAIWKEGWQARLARSNRRNGGSEAEPQQAVAGPSVDLGGF